MTSSLFLMAISIPRILVVLASSKVRFWFLSRIERSDEMLQKYPILQKWIPQVVIEAWREPKGAINAINGELKKLTDLGKSFIEGATAAIFLIVATLHLGVDGGAGLIIAMLIAFLIVSVIIGVIFTIRCATQLTALLNKLQSNQAKPQTALPEPLAQGV
jgi:hypothetical protein